MWVGSDKLLDEILSGQPHGTIDILDVFADREELPSDSTWRRDEIRRRLEVRLRELQPPEGQRLILRVKSVGLLSRYEVGLEPFFDFFGLSRTMAILCVERESPDLKWPVHLERGIAWQPDGLVRYLTARLADPNKVFREQGK